MQSRRKLLARVLHLRDLFLKGDIPRPPLHEVYPDVPLSSRERYLYFTLPVSINFQRNSPAMWRAALATWNDPATQYVFFPELVANVRPRKLQRDLLKYRLALQTNKHPKIWASIAQTLHRQYADHPKNVLKAGRFAVPEVLYLLQVDKKTYFPYLSGNKLSHYWLYILHHFTDAPLKKLESLSIIPDTHVQQSSVHLGLTKEGESPMRVTDAWRVLLEGSGVSPYEMHSVLWHWSRNKFQPAV